MTDEFPDITVQSPEPKKNILSRCFSKFIKCISKKPLIIVITIGIIGIVLLIISIVPASACNSNLCDVLSWFGLISAIICIFITIMIAIYVGLCTRKNKKNIASDYTMTSQTDVKFEINDLEEIDDLPDLKNKEK
jgi:hypothetical protein